MKPLSVKIVLLLSVTLLAFMVPGGARASDPVTITILTLDDRPPNNLFLKQLAAIAGIDLVVEFDPSAASTADCVSLNAAVAGSLVGSRSADPCTLAPPSVRPDALIHFALPRVEPTVLEQANSPEYSRVRQALQDPDIQRAVLAAIQSDSGIENDPCLASYADRMKGWLEFLGRADYDPNRLLITLDDNRPGPLSDGLKILFGRFSNFVYDGTDEGMMLLLARALRERQDGASLPTTCCVVWTDPEGMLSVQPFEGAMPVENVLTMSRWLGVRLSPNCELYEPWRPMLWIHDSSADETHVPDRVRSVSERIGDRPVIVADIARPNGGDPALIDTWAAGATPPGLIGYLGWDTSSNTLGSAMALWTAVDFAWWHSSDPEGVRAGIETFLWSRFLDDYLYQRIVRSEVTDILRSESIDPYHIAPERAADVAESIAQRLSELWIETGEPLAIPLRFVDPIDHTRFVVELPWNRLFEITLYPTDDRGILPVIRPIEP